MPTLESKVNPRDPTFARNRDAMAALVADMRERIAKIELGGGETVRSSNCRSSPPTACTTTTSPARG